MDIDLDTGKLIIFLVGVLFFLIIETIVPKRRQNQKKIFRLLFHGGIATVNTILIRSVTYVPLLLWIVFVEQKGWGISRLLALSGLVELLASIVILDLFDYFWHRANHRFIPLWRFHKAHHTDTSIDVTTALRFHPGELAISSAVKAVWIVLWGPSVIAWFIFEAAVSFCSQFHHSNIDFSDKSEKIISALIVTPRFHASHHAVDRRYGDRNFSTIFSMWDRLFRSFRLPLKNEDPNYFEIEMGLPESRDLAFSATSWLKEPLQSSNLRLISKKQVFRTEMS
jgi:sterol desaturase/sphingolipid hydroxylase (fatty acid hydroxylase superfamily)